MFNPKDNKDRRYIVILHSIPGFGPRTLRTLCDDKNISLEYFYTRTSFKDVLATGVTKQSAENLIASRRESQDKIFFDIEKNNISFTTLYDDDYPPLLKEISSPPVVLFYKGKIPSWEEQTISSIVGTRQLTSYGEKATDMLCNELVAHDDIIISGLAYGIDACAHKSTLRYGGVTIAILPADLTYIIPRTHENLAQEIIHNGGLIISEIAPKKILCKGSFPQRNRIIAGMSHRTFVIEAGEKSGALITAKYAIEANRDVYAIPGPITSQTSEGCNKLISEGALIYRGPGSIYPSGSHEKTVVIFNSIEEKDLYEIIKKKEPITTDNILQNLPSYKISDLNILLSTLEIRGLLRYSSGRWSTS